MKRLIPIAFALPLAALVAAAPAAAQNQSKNDPNRPTVSQLVAQDDARIAQLKANLRLNQDQESDWGKLENALKDISKRRAERRIALLDEYEKREKPLTHAEMLRKHADAMAARAEELRAIADAAEPLTEKFNPQQRQRVDNIIRTYVQAPLLN
jgi:hypothetical protein